jgi:hypothetical protein
LYDNAGVAGEYPTSGANSVVLRDANQNVSANSIYVNATSVAASGTTINMTAASSPAYVVTGSGGQTIVLPDATTLPLGAIFTFNNNQSSGAITVQIFGGGSTVSTVQSGSFVEIVLLANGTSAGTWDPHYFVPANASWSTNTLSWAGSITNTTWNGAVVGVLYGGTGTTTATGTAGSVVLSNSPTLVTPNIGAATGTSLALSSATGLTLGGSVLAKTNTLLFTLLSYYIAPSSTATTISVTGASWTSGVATLTFSAITTKLPIGAVITITGITPSGYNVSNVQVTASTTTSVSYALASNPGAYSSGGSIGNGTTYTPSSGAVVADVLVCGSGGGGGGGVVNATAVSGGAGGGGGASAGRRYRLTEIGGSAAITVGVGGTAGGVGVAGGAGSLSSFVPTTSLGNGISGYGGGGGYFGGVSTSTGGGGAGGNSFGNGASGTISAGGSASSGSSAGGFAANGSTLSSGYTFGGAGGSGGGGGSTTAGFSGGAQAAGGASGGGSGGANSPSSSGAGGQVGGGQAFGGGSGNNGNSTGAGTGSNGLFNPIMQAWGASGGGGTTTLTAGSGGHGANGSGGGGGGSATTGSAGTGGKGGDGFVSIVEYF